MVSPGRGPADAARLRLRVEGLAAAGFEWGPEDVPELSGRDPEVRPLPATGQDRALGVRRFEVAVGGWVFRVAVEDEARARLRDRAGQGSGAEATSGVDIVTARIPGRVVRLWVAEGDTVEVGQRLLAIEAMKMENEVRAVRAGSVDSIRVALGSGVELGDELLTVR